MRKRYKLTAAKVAAIRKPGRHSDGGNLILRVSKQGDKSWGYRFGIDGRERTAGLGPLRRVSLAEARVKAEAMGKLLAAGLDPLDERNKSRAAKRAAAARLITFREAAKRFLADREGTWRNEQHRRDFSNSLDTHILPMIGGLSVGDVDTPAVLKVLEPIWRVTPETANRCRSRIELVLDWCTARSYRDGANPAKWRGHLDHILPAPKTLAPTKHHPALPWQQAPAFMADLRGRDGVVPRALEFCILNASRIGEVLGATWSEIDFAAKTWTIPGDKMKSGREHVVPLSARALAILKAMPRDGERIFQTHRATTGQFLRERMGRADITTHGFRSTFSTWTAEATRFESDVREAALAHAIRNKTIAAYQRGTLLAKRRLLMDAWAGFCAAPPVKGETVVKMRRG
ncbi:tyrosine-type recombinase/integrase [Bradyrhizobium sp. McL0616]|uniref:tyrosine-type recombinase/integrase n=1 Tax=Bradyrhizobium sp. McL0616 TaxID=3415674 RepID=UPI003CEDA978